MGKSAVIEMESFLDCLEIHVREQLTFQCGFEFWEKLEHPLERQLLDQFGEQIKNSLGHHLSQFFSNSFISLSAVVTPNMASP